MKKDIHPKMTFQIYTDVKCFGPGVAELLNGVKEHHSLRASANALNMAYSKAWTVIKNCEEQFGFKLLNSVAGGKNGGGAVLTEEAERLLRDYYYVRDELNRTAKSLFDERLNWLLPKDT